MADNAGKKTFRAAVFPENEHCMGISEQTVPECGIDDKVIGFLLQTWKIVQDCVAYIGKGNPVFTEKRIKISRISRQTDYNKVCLL